MKKLIPVILLALPTASMAQSAQHLSSEAHYRFSTGGYTLVDSAHYTYPAMYKPAYQANIPGWNYGLKATYEVNGSGITAKNKLTQTTDAAGRVTEVLNEYNFGNGWQESSKYFYTYDASGNITERESWSPSGPNGPLKMYWKETYAFNTANQLTEVINYRWDNMVVPQQYTAQTRTTYTYNGTQLTTILEERNNNGSWEPTTRNNYTYPTPTIVEMIVERYNPLNSSWTPSVMNTETLDANGNVIHNLTAIYAGSGNWENDHEYHYTYDAANNMLTNEVKDWDNGILEPSVLYAYTYNSDNHKTSYVLKEWDGSAYVPANGNDSIRYHYAFPTGIATAAKSKNDVQIYPVPASNSITIRFANDDNAAHTATLLNATGQVVKHTQLAGNMAQVDVQDVPAGNYILQVHNGASVATQKIVIAR